MSKISIYDTPIISSINPEKNLNDAISFLANSRGSISVSSKISKLIYDPSNILLNTIISDIFKKFLKENKLNLFFFADLSTKTSIPEILLYNYINIDVFQLKDKFKHAYDALKSFPEYHNRIIYNITDIISANNTKLDSSILHQIVVRDLLSRSYYNFDRDWLTPSILYYLTKFYAISISSNFGRIYNLNYKDQMIIATIFSIYFLQQCHSEKGINPLISRMDFLSKFINIKDIVDLIKDEHGDKDLSFTDLISVIKIALPQRLSDINQKTIYSLGRNFNINQIMSLISLDYPPYWCYNVLLAISGIKSNLYHTLKKLNLMNDLVKFGTEIKSSKQFMDSIF